MIVPKLQRRLEGFRETWDYDLAVKRLGLVKCRSDPVLETAPIFCCKFCPTPGLTHILAYADEEGKVFMLNTKKDQNANFRNNKSCNELIASFISHYNAVFDVAWTASDYKLVTVSGDHAAHLWDVQTQECLAVFSIKTHSVKSAVFKPESDTVFSVGGRNGTIYVCDIREDPTHADKIFIQSLMQIPQAHEISNVKSTAKRKRTNYTAAPRFGSITSLCFQDEYHLISCADGDGAIKIWDLRNIRHQLYRSKPSQPFETVKHPESNSNRGFTSLTVDQAGIYLYASCYDSNVYRYNISTYETKPICSYVGHEANSYYVKIALSPDGRYLLSGSKDSAAYIWKVDSPPWPLVSLPDHIGEVTAVAWSPDVDSYFKVVACSDEPSPAIWRVETNISEKSSDLTVVRSAKSFEVPESSKKAPLPNLPLDYQKILKVQSASNDTQSTFSPTDNLPNFGHDESHFLCREVKCRTSVTKKNWLTEITLNKLTLSSAKSSSCNSRKTPSAKVTPKSVSSEKVRRKRNSVSSRKVNLLQFFQSCSNT